MVPAWLRRVQDWNGMKKQNAVQIMNELARRAKER